MADTVKQFTEELRDAMSGVAIPSEIAISAVDQTPFENLTRLALLNYERMGRNDPAKQKLATVLMKFNAPALDGCLKKVCEDQYRRMAELERIVEGKERVAPPSTEYIALLRKEIKAVRARNCDLVTRLTNRVQDSAADKIAFTLSEIDDNELVIRELNAQSVLLDRLESDAAYMQRLEAEDRRRMEEAAASPSTEGGPSSSSSPSLPRPAKRSMTRQNATASFD